MIAFDPSIHEDWTSGFELTVSSSTQTITLNPNDFIQLPEWSEVFRIAWQSGIRYHHKSLFQLKLSKLSEPAQHLTSMLSQYHCHLFSVLLTFNSVPLFRGFISEWNEFDHLLQITAKMRAPWGTDQFICRDLSLLSEGGMYHKPKWISVVFGRHDRIQAIPLFNSTAAFTRTSLHLESQEIPLRSQPNWPASGFVQVNDEVIYYQEYQLSPPVLLGLTRANPLEHSDRSQVMALPNVPLNWIIADHPVLVRALWSSPDEDEKLGIPDIIEEQVSGQLATLAMRDQFPLLISHEIFSVPLSIPTAPLDWQIIPPSNVVSPTDAFVDFTTPTRGAEFSASHSLMIARFTKELNFGIQRFDLLDQLSLRFEVHSNRLWGQTTRFLIEVTDGTNTVSKQLIRDDLFLPEALTETQKLMPSKLIQSKGNVSLFRKVNFTSLDETSRNHWLNWKNLFSLSDDLFASHLFTASTFHHAKLIFKVPSDKETQEAKNISFFCRVRSITTEAQCRLRILAPGNIHHESVFTANAQWQTIELSLSLAGISTDEIIRASTAFEVFADEECHLQVSSAWLELEESQPVTVEGLWNSQLLPKTEESNATQVSGLAIDLAELLSEGNRWAVFNGDGEGLQIRFQLINPEQGFAISLQNVRFETMLRPARSVRLSSELYADIDGLATDIDGHCNPADVIRELISSPQFLGDNTLWDEIEFDAIHHQLEEIGIRFRAHFQSTTKLTEALDDAFTESLLWLKTTNHPYQLASISDILNAPATVTLNQENQLDSGCSIQTTPPELCADALILKNQSTGIVLHRKHIENGRGTETWFTRWVSKGFEALANFATDEFNRPVQLLHCKAPGSFADVTSGSVVHAQGFPEIHSAFDAIIQSKKWKNGIVDFVCCRRPEFTLLWSHGPASIYGCHAPSSIRFTISNQNILSLFEGKLHSSLRIRESVLEEEYPLGLNWNEEEESISLITSDGSHQVGFVLKLSGELISTHPIIESPYSDIIATRPIDISDETLILSMPGNKPVFYINAHTHLIQFFYELTTI